MDQKQLENNNLRKVRHNRDNFKKKFNEPSQSLTPRHEASSTGAGFYLGSDSDDSYESESESIEYNELELDNFN